MPTPSSRTGRARAALAFVCALVLTACGAPDPALNRDAPYDPYEAENRRMHAFNRSLDRTLIRSAGKGYSSAVPDDIEMVIGNFADNMSLPVAIVNNILQGNGKSASEDFYRFLVNSTIGLGGLFDTATELEMPAPSGADFGQTLYVWGVHEGPYIELPLLGPSTTRDAVGRTVDLFANPLKYALESPESYIPTAASASKALTTRGRYSETIDSVLYDSADSYAASRSLYLQNRRFKVGRGSSDAYLDPYDTGSGAQTSPGDSYEDPYDE
ncbi:VacJ family lipoprotein [Roseovarius spongiae]|uniref:VacJ family lipoprotein n=1 Tax=Roseovarius spongiae TaxID=2320272 RepID=A0A3A8B449_9RHOB|nr:VacJ family lipoprotein [Roseovarius spongiae]RKF12880.1 VacJ family lipoprotein [Roseovarius spongiae]